MTEMLQVKFLIRITSMPVLICPQKKLGPLKAQGWGLVAWLGASVGASG